MTRSNDEPYRQYNFQVERTDEDAVRITLTDPPQETAPANGKVRHVEINQDSDRDSDGIRVHYDFNRDGFVVEQPRPVITKLKDGSTTDELDWVEVGFFQSWMQKPVRL